MSTLAAPQNATTAWNIDPVHSVAEFKVKHMMISNVKGQFTRVKGALALDETDLTSSHVEASIEAPSIDTRDADRDAHSEKRGLPARREVSRAVLQVDAHNPHRPRRTGGRGRPDHSRRHPQRGICG